MDQWAWLGFLMGVILAIFVGALAGVILYLILTNRINLSGLISETTGEASLSRFQFLVFTFVIAMSLFYLTAIDGVFPRVPAEILGLLGISGGSYVLSKGIQTTRDTSLERIESERTAHDEGGGSFSGMDPVNGPPRSRATTTGRAPRM